MKRDKNERSHIYYLLLYSAFLITSCAVEPRKTVPEEYRAGQIIFHQVCANCHGPDAMGGNKAPKLIQNRFNPENFSNGKIARTILNGSSSGAMPSQKDKLSDEEIRQVIKYIRYSQKMSGLTS